MTSIKRLYNDEFFFPSKFERLRKKHVDVFYGFLSQTYFREDCRVDEFVGYVSFIR